MAYVGSDPELAAAAAEMHGAAPKDDAPAPKPAKGAKAKEREPEPKLEEETPEVPAEEPEPAAAKDDDDEAEGEKPEPKDEKKPDEDEDAKVSKGFAALARAQRKDIEKRQAWEAHATRIAQGLEERKREADQREASLKEREERASRFEQVAERAKAGDHESFFALAEEMGVTPEAVIAWVQKAPSSPSERAALDKLSALEKRIEERERREKEEREAAQRQTQEQARQRAHAEFVRSAQDAEKYPFLNAIKTAPQILQEATELLRQVAAEGQVDPRSLTDEQILNYMNSEAEKALRSNEKLRALYGVAPQQNGHNGAPASKPATARTLTQTMTSQKAKASIILDDDDDAEAIRQLREARARDAARV